MVHEAPSRLGGFITSGDLKEPLDHVSDSPLLPLHPVLAQLKGERNQVGCIQAGARSTVSWGGGTEALAAVKARQGGMLYPSGLQTLGSHHKSKSLRVMVKEVGGGMPPLLGHQS